TAMILHDLTTLRKMEPYCNMNPMLLVYQALLADTHLGVANVEDRNDRLEVQDTLSALYEQLIPATFKDLPASIADNLQYAWQNQFRNAENPVSKLVRVASLLNQILFILDETLSGNVLALQTCTKYIVALEQMRDSSLEDQSGDTLHLLLTPMCESISQAVQSLGGK